jgi:hypothetical protein
MIKHASLPAEDAQARDNAFRVQLSSRARTLQYATWPDLEENACLVCEYNSKELSFAKDVFNAFLGVMITFGQTFDRGILYGLPEMYFDVALLWQPFGELKRRQKETRREDYQREEHKREYNHREERRPHYRVDTRKENVMPSWSWMGWQGQLDPRSWACGL